MVDLNFIQNNSTTSIFRGFSGVEGYVGIPLFSSENRPLGLISALFKRPLDSEEHLIRSYLRIFAARASAELERRQDRQKIRKLNSDLERKIRERTAELEASNRELEAFCFSVSHDLRAPLRSISGFSEALVEDCGGELSDRGKDFLNRICRSTEQMGQLIDDLLTLSRLSRKELEFGPVDLSKIVEDQFAVLRQRDPDRKVEAVIAPDIEVWGDETLLQSALQNLVGNAWKFTSQEEVGHIEFGWEEQDGHQWYFVRDNGVGFDSKYGDKLFQPFQRLHSTRDFPGSGVGLASVQRIVERHGGVVKGKSELGQGATFSFTLAAKNEPS